VHVFDEDTRVEQVAPGLFAGRISDRWGIGLVPNGGYVLSVAMAALRGALPGLDPLTVTAHFLRPAKVGEARIVVEVVKAGRRFSTVAARLEQDSGEVIRVLGTYGRIAHGSAPVYVAGSPPLLPPRESLVPAWSGTKESPPEAGTMAMTIRERFDVRFDPATSAFQRGERGESAELRGWLRFSDGRLPDVHALGLLADALPPPVFNLLSPGWVPTVELTVHVRAHPVGEWLRCVFRTRFVQNGLLEEDGEIWDESGTLVALSRQMAAMPQPQRRA